MTTQFKAADNVEALSTKGDTSGVRMARVPTAVRVANEIFSENPHRGINPGEQAAIDAAIQDVKRWYDGF